MIQFNLDEPSSRNSGHQGRGMVCCAEEYSFQKVQVPRGWEPAGSPYYTFFALFQVSLSRAELRDETIFDCDLELLLWHLHS
jgi:hypothetical protein